MAKGVGFRPAVSGVIEMEQVVRRLNDANAASVMDTAEKIKRDTVAHLYRVWEEDSGAAGRSVQIRGEASHTGSTFRTTTFRGVKGGFGGQVGTGGYSVQVGSFYDAGNFQRGINHFVLLEGGFTLRSGRFKPGKHSLAFATQLHAGNLPAHWQRVYTSGARANLVR